MSTGDHGTPGAEPVTGWFPLRAGQQAAGMILARPWVMALPALTAAASAILFTIAAYVASAVLAVSAVLQALLPLGLARRVVGSGERRVAVRAGRRLEIRSPNGEVHQWDLLRCRVRRSPRRLHVEVTPGRAIVVPRSAVGSTAEWEALCRAILLEAPARSALAGPYVPFRTDERATRPFDLPVPATIGVLFRQQARTLTPLLLLLTVIDVALAPTATLRGLVVVVAAAVGGWSMLAGSTVRVLALARRDITRGNVVEASDRGILHNHPGCCSLRPWDDVTTVRSRRGGAAEIRYGRRRTIIPAGAFADGAHRDAFVSSATQLACSRGGSAARTVG